MLAVIISANILYNELIKKYLNLILLPAIKGITYEFYIYLFFNLIKAAYIVKVIQAAFI